MSKTKLRTSPPYNYHRINFALNILFGGILLGIIASCHDSRKSSPVRQIDSFTNDPSLINDKLFVISEYEIGMRERALAQIVFERTNDAEVRALAKTVREGHQLGIEKLTAIANELKISLPGSFRQYGHLLDELAEQLRTLVR